MLKVVLYDRDCNPNAYQCDTGVRLITEDGTVQDFFPTNAEEVTVEVDFSDGDMSVEPSKGALIEKVTIVKPSALVPDNIAEGVEIAGIVGTFSAAPAQTINPILAAFAYNIDVDANTITLWKFFQDKWYAYSGSYDITIPDTIDGYKVVISCV